MKFLVLGAGRLGHAITFDLIRSPKVEQVVLADRDVDRVQAVKERVADEKVVPVELDATNQDYAGELMSSADVTVSCLPGVLNYELAKLALGSSSHYCDLGSNQATTDQILALADLASEQGVTLIPGLGLSPALVSILSVGGADSMDELYEIRMRAGAVPVDPEEHLLECVMGLSAESLIDEYVNPCKIVRDGKVYDVPSLSDVEEIEFPGPLGTMEAFNTSGGVANIVELYKGRVKHLDYKSVRYPGHCEQISLLADLGLLSPDKLKINKTSIVPKELLAHLLDQKLSKDVPDVAVARVVITGVVEDKPMQHVWESIDYGNEADGLSAMGRMTAFPASIVAQMIARKDIEERGAFLAEQVVPFKLFLAEMSGRGMSLTMTEKTSVYN